MLNLPADLPDLKSFTKSFVLYPFAMDHADELGEIISNEGTWTQGYLDGAPLPANPGDAKALIAVWMLPNPTYTILTNEENQRVIGAMNIVESDSENAFARLGHLIVHPDFWQIDVRLEMVATMLDFLFDHGAARIEAREDSKNVPSLNVLRRLGFKDEGVRRNSIQRHDGVWLDRMVVSIIPEEWSAGRERVQQMIVAARNR